MHTCMCVCVRACYFITSQQSSLGSVIYHKPTNPPTHPCPPTTTPPPTHPYSYSTHPSPHLLHPSTNSFTYAPQPHSTHTVILTHTHTHTHTILKQFLQVVRVTGQLQKQSAALHFVRQVFIQHVQILVHVVDVGRLVHLRGIYPGVLGFVQQLCFSRRSCNSKLCCTAGAQ